MGVTGSTVSLLKVSITLSNIYHKNDVLELSRVLDKIFLSTSNINVRVVVKVFTFWR